jgi:hypothetical protein
MIREQAFFSKDVGDEEREREREQEEDGCGDGLHDENVGACCDW